MMPFCWSGGGGFQERVRELVVARTSVRPDGAPVGTRHVKDIYDMSAPVKTVIINFLSAYAL